MAVGTLDVYRLSVDEQLSVLDFNFAETGAHGHSLHVLVVLLHGDNHLVEVRSLGSPLQRVLHVELHSSVDFSHILALLLLHLGGVEHLAAHDVSVWSEKVDDEFGVALALDVHGKRAVLVLSVEVGSHADIINMSRLRARVEEAVAGHAREAPEVLVLRVGTVAPAERLEGNEVVAFLEIWSDVELGS